MSTSLTIGYEWLPNEFGDESERLTLADLAINVGELCATWVEDIPAKTVRSSARLSALHLAQWFAANWWRLLWEPQANTYPWRASHKIGNAGNGYVWPDLTFSSDWQSVIVSARPTRRWDAEPIRYLNTFDVPISISDFERGVADFIEGAVSRLSIIMESQSELGMLWGEVVNERRDPEISQRRRLEASMGYDPGEGPSSLLDSLQEQMGVFGTSAIQEMAAAYQDQAISRTNELWEDGKRNGPVIRVPKCDDIRTTLETDSYRSDIPWQRATRAAQIAREVWGLETPISTATLSDLFSVGEEKFWESDPVRGSTIAGFRDTDASDRFNISWSNNHPTSRRFAVARLVGDHIVTNEEEMLLPGTRVRTSRQKFQRAFAQELLCPFDALREYLNTETPDIDDVNDAARHFDVSPLMIQTTLVNKGILDREALAGWAE